MGFFGVEFESFDCFGDEVGLDFAFFGEGVESSDDRAFGIDFKKAAELFAAAQGADYIRTHDPAALRDALAVAAALQSEAQRISIANL